MQNRPTRQRRLEALTEFVRLEQPKNQAELQSLLATEGYEVNQATLSRDLREIGVVKGPNGYQLPETNGSNDRLGRAINEWLLRISPVSNQIVLRTAPGGATPIALALDDEDLGGVLGTIAGDDTVLVICDGAGSARSVAQMLQTKVAT
ncbi:MAG: ArgR family transcriptional regulator [Planctomycetota bacterium]